MHLAVHVHIDISPGRPFAPCGRSRAHTPQTYTLLIASQTYGGEPLLARSPLFGTIYK